jgi:hypothetical protein
VREIKEGKRRTKCDKKVGKRTEILLFILLASSQVCNIFADTFVATLEYEQASYVDDEPVVETAVLQWHSQQFEPDVAICGFVGQKLANNF